MGKLELRLTSLLCEYTSLPTHEVGDCLWSGMSWVPQRRCVSWQEWRLHLPARVHGNALWDRWVGTCGNASLVWIMILESETGHAVLSHHVGIEWGITHPFHSPVPNWEILEVNCWYCSCVSWDITVCSSTACQEGKFGHNCQESCTKMMSCKGFSFCLLDPYGCSCASGWHGALCNESKINLTF